ncbi:MAG: C40 family peptidase [Bacteroidales bacterium]
MQYGVCLNSLAALREEASHKSQMVSQLLFGDIFEIIDKQDDWLNIKMKYDEYSGWVASNQVVLISRESYNDFLYQPIMISGDIIQIITNETTGNSFPISAGCSLYGNDHENLNILGEKYKYNGSICKINKKPSLAASYAIFFLNSPYLWGGRSSMGIDCSALVQLAYKMTGIIIPRDSSLQAHQGSPVHLIDEVEAGDLCFFDDDEGNINHVGLIIDKQHIIHSHGKVRIDLIDHNGIFSKEKKKYTHKLRLIKRV